MKLRLLKSGLVLAIAIFTVASSANALFTSTAVAANNQVSTGSMGLAIYSIDPNNLETGKYLVVSDIGGVTFPGSTLELWDSAIPGESKSYWIAVSNEGSMPFSYSLGYDGEWSPLGESCTDEPEAISHTLAAVSDDNCTDSVCSALLSSFGGTATPGDTLAPGEFSIYEVNLTFSSEAGNCYQGAAYDFTITGTGSQVVP